MTTNTAPTTDTRLPGRDNRGATEVTVDELLQAYADGRRDFRRTYLRGANLERANLGRAHLSGAHLSWADLSGADLYGANLYWADLDRANLARANLDRANLSWADLSGANLSGADLYWADLSGAHLSGAHLGEGVRLHDSGVWTRPWPRVSAGDWHGWCVAPGIVRIGCTTLTVDEWIERGEQIADKNDVSITDRYILRTWIEMLADLGDKLDGWVPDARS